MDALQEALQGAHHVEDVVQYRIYVKDCPGPGPERAAYLRAKAVVLLAEVRGYVEGIVWNKDIFALDVGLDEEVPCLWGDVRVGDSIDDEWFVVYLLRLLTTRFTDILVTVVDGDGELILIEAAHVLPAWVTPDNVAHRVFLHQGAVHLIGPDLVPLYDALNLTDAVTMVVRDSSRTRAPTAVQVAIDARIAQYPGVMRGNVHRTNVRVPSGVAAVLAKDPSLLAAAVDAYQQRDAIDMRICKQMATFPANHAVYAHVAMTRCQYAALARHERFVVPRVFGIAPPEASPRYLPFMVGAKLACGMEMLMGRKGASGESSPEAGEWEACVIMLRRLDYFKGFDLGTPAFEERMQAARECFGMRPGVMVDGARERIMTALRGVDVEEYARQHAGGLGTLPAGDSDEWMNVTPDQLETMWKERAGEQGGLAEPQAAVNVLQEFLTKMQSDVEGVETPGDVNLDVQGLVEHLRELLGEKASESETDELDEFLGDDLDESIAHDMDEYYDDMANELAHTKVAEGFVSERDATALAAGQPVQDDDANAIGDGAAVHVELNLLKNMLESYSAQEGLAGPVGNVMRSLGLTLPDNADDDATS